ncbi:tRNA pseudouridine(38-40) synthase TruA [Flavihumibacter petaseus]|uniref:tRNA pseudouridine synthase A n=1 Tax=Flavihumibacter petaseus NBRC 106054 TaxID=1220578 RepID=A0A0E9N4N3_9BACT|nr:tRNA pseudouridine(38-40) synthase TruA [Flavihumibacter petaseus]GAO44758.1 tRNA pseudouridine synthase TruA [Flavihumibacter petaseus NBRC 106054]
MNRYFIEVAYLGAAYAGFQRQENAHTVQAEVERVLQVVNREKVMLTGSSRTDAGVHARQNYFHYDFDGGQPERLVYNLNALLPRDCAVLSLRRVPAEAHCRFDAIGREYRYYCYGKKDPFREGRAYFYPYSVDMGRMQEAAGILMEYEDFTSFSKRNTQVKTFRCRLTVSQWEEYDGGFLYHVKGNRFLRGMVRALTATMLRVGRGSITLERFREIIEGRDCTLADFAVPAEGLFLERVHYPEGYFEKM